MFIVGDVLVKSLIQTTDTFTAYSALGKKDRSLLSNDLNMTRFDVFCHIQFRLIIIKLTIDMVNNLANVFIA